MAKSLRSLKALLLALPIFPAILSFMCRMVSLRRFLNDNTPCQMSCHPQAICRRQPGHRDCVCLQSTVFRSAKICHQHESLATPKQSAGDNQDIVNVSVCNPLSSDLPKYATNMSHVLAHAIEGVFVEAGEICGFPPLFVAQWRAKLGILCKRCCKVCCIQGLEREDPVVTKKNAALCRLAGPLFA
jgi:hypothetical protein